MFRLEIPILALYIFGVFVGGFAVLVAPQLWLTAAILVTGSAIAAAISLTGSRGRHGRERVRNVQKAPGIKQ